MASARDVILETTKKLLLRQEANSLSFVEIASEANVSRPTVYSYFKDRDGLYVALAEEIMNKCFAVVDVRMKDKYDYYHRLRGAIVGALAQGDHAQVAVLLRESKKEFNALFDFFAEELYINAPVVCRLADSSAVFSIMDVLVAGLSSRMNSHSFIGLGVESGPLNSEMVLQQLAAGSAWRLVSKLRAYVQYPEDLSREELRGTIQELIDFTYRAT